MTITCYAKVASAVALNWMARNHVTQSFRNVQLALVAASIASIVYRTLQANPTAALRDSEKIAEFSIVHLANVAMPYFWIHEGGHAAAALTCFQKANPKVRIKPFKYGVTEYAISNGLTKVGQVLGQKGSTVTVKIAGLVSSAIFSGVELVASRKIKHGAILEMHGLSQIVHEVLEGVRVFWINKNDPTHDLMALWQDEGIHPLLPLSLAIGPIFARYIIFR